MARSVRLGSQGDSFSTGGQGGWTTLRGIAIGTGVASASVVVFASNPSNANSKLSTLAAANTTTPSYVDFFGTECKDGLQVYLLGGNADVTITYE